MDVQTPYTFGCPCVWMCMIRNNHVTIPKSMFLTKLTFHRVTLRSFQYFFVRKKEYKKSIRWWHRGAMNILEQSF